MLGEKVQLSGVNKLIVIGRSRSFSWLPLVTVQVCLYCCTLFTKIDSCFFCPPHESLLSVAKAVVHKPFFYQSIFVIVATRVASYSLGNEKLLNFQVCREQLRPTQRQGHIRGSANSLEARNLVQLKSR